jgi:O-antigen ligase
MSASWLARLFFGITIILIPFRFRYSLVERPAPPVYKDFTDFLLFGSDIALLVLLGFWGLSLLFLLRPVNLGPKFMWMPLMGLIVTCLITSFTSLDVKLSLYNTLRLILLFLFYLYIINELRSYTLVIISVTIQVIVQSFIALGQFFLQRSVGLQAFGEHTLNPSVRGVSIVSTGVTRLLRSYGLAEHPNILGGCLAFGLILFLAVYLDGQPNVRLWISFVMVIGLSALFVTFSRSAWLAFLMGTLILLGNVALAHDWKKLRSVVWLALASLLVLAPLVGTYSGYVGARLNFGGSFSKNPYEIRSIAERLLLDRAGLHIFLDKPFTGVGLGTSAIAIRKYFPHFRGSFVPPHLVLLAVAIELGIVGLIFYIFSLLIPWVELLKYKVVIRRKPILLIMSVLLMAITLIGFFDIYPWLPPTGRLWQWLIWGLWVVAYETQEQDSEIEHIPN